MTLVIDCHGHYTTAPAAHNEWRDRLPYFRHQVGIVHDRTVLLNVQLAFFNDFKRGSFTVFIEYRLGFVLARAPFEHSIVGFVTDPLACGVVDDRRIAVHDELLAYLAVVAGYFGFIGLAKR